MLFRHIEARNAVTFASESLLAVLCLLLIIGLIIDIRARILPNWLTFSVATLAPLCWYAEGLVFWPDISARLGLTVACFAVFALVYVRGGMGGGDVKLISALALWMQPAILMQFLIAMSLFGGVLSLFMWANAFRQRKAAGAIEVPYGVAISLGTFWVVPQMTSAITFPMPF